MSTTIDPLRVAKRLVTLLVLVGFAYLLLGLRPDPAGVVVATMLLGFVLLAAYVAGSAASGLGLPSLTGYVLVGIAVGPYALGILSQEMVASMRTIDEIALALIALTAGGELKLEELRRAVGAIVGISVTVMLVTVAGIMALVLAARPLVPLFAGEPFGFALAVAILLAIWCANSSPDATIAVMNEEDAHGRFAEIVLGVTILKDVLVIVAFAAALAFVGPLVDPAASFHPSLFGTIAWEVGGALVIGAIAGAIFAYYLSNVGARSIVATLIFTFLLTLVAHELHVELLLTAVGAGFIIENYSEAGDQLIHAIEANSLVVYAIFFALAGAALDLNTVARFWPVAVVIVAVRAGLTWAGARLGARLGGEADGPVARYAWMGFISQAGVTLGLSLLVAREFPEWGGRFVAVTTAVIIFHLLIGPVMLKRALARSGREAATATGGAAPVAQSSG